MKSKKILIAVLNWGLGHAARCIPVILEFYRQGAEIFIASDGRSLELLKKEFPELVFLNLKGYDIKYPENGSMVLQMVLQASKISSAIKREHIELEKIVDENKIDIVFSDNRYGCWSKKVYSVFMTHQLNIQAPDNFKWAEPFILSKNKKFISKYNECWVPDFEGEENLSANLSHNTELKNLKFIGPLTRFDLSRRKKPVEDSYELCVICSGPEPQRTLFENLLTKEILKTTLRSILIQGITEIKKETQQKNNLKIVSYASSSEMQNLIESSSVIISRPGYSTIMDIAALGKKAIFIPTPGQTEQEYLAQNFMDKKVFYSSEQKDFNLAKALHEYQNYSGVKISPQPELLSRAIKSLLSK